MLIFLEHRKNKEYKNPGGNDEIQRIDLAITDGDHWRSLMANCVEHFSGNAHGFIFDKDDVVVLHVTRKALLNLRWYDKVLYHDAVRTR